MEKETTNHYQSPTEKIYKEREIWVGTLLGGTLAAGYMVAENYRAFGETGKARKTWMVTAAATAFIFYVSFFAPYIDRIPSQIFSLVCAGFIIALVQVYQGERIRTHIRGGGKIQSWWKAIASSIAGAAVTLALMFGIAYLIGVVQDYGITSKTYGRMQHVVYYDKTNISESEVDQIADAAMATNLFLDSSGKWYAYARKVNTDYEISLSMSHDTFNNAAYLKFLKDERGYMQAHFPNNKIIINLVEGDFNNIQKRIE